MSNEYLRDEVAVIHASYISDSIRAANNEAKAGVNVSKAWGNTSTDRQLRNICLGQYILPPAKIYLG